jgi:hydrogenase maturation protease
LLVLGVGNDLREDDAVGLELVRRLQAEFGPELEAEEIGELDLALAPRLAACERLLVVDAAAEAGPGPYRLETIEPAQDVSTPRGFATHLFDWGFLLAVARDVFGRAPHAQVLAIAGERFGIGQGLSPACARNAEAAYGFLVRYCTEPSRAG